MSRPSVGLDGCGAERTLDLATPEFYRRPFLRPAARTAVGVLCAGVLLLSAALPAQQVEKDFSLEDDVRQQILPRPELEDEDEGDDDEEPRKKALKRNAPPDGAITFEFPLEEEDGGGSVSGWAGALQFESETEIALADGVVLFYRNYIIQAERLEIDTDTQIVEANLGVILDQGPQRLAGATLVFDLETETGTMTEADAYLSPDIYVKGREISKVGPETFKVVDGVFTSCEDDVPDWSFALGSATLTVEGYARVKNAVMKVKKLPVLYTPYILWPVKSDRASGFLIPQVGYSERRGYELGLAYFQTLGDSYDITLLGEIYGEDYSGAGFEFRYRPSEKTKGELTGYAINDPIEDKWRWKGTWEHSTEDLPFGMRGVVSYIDFSDFEFFRDFERNFNRVTFRRLYSSAFLSGNWGAHSMNLLVDDRETFIREGDIINQRQLPELEYRLRSTKLGVLPLYLDVLSSASLLSVTRTTALDQQYGRFDFAPNLTLPIRSAPWLSLSLSAGGRATWYGDSVDETGTEFTGESVSRVYPAAGADIVGPSFSKVFDWKVGPFGKFKHLIEPRFTYRYRDEFDDAELIPLFDEIDNILPGNIGGYSVVQRLLAKPDDEELGSAREILSFELGQSYSFNDEQPFQQTSDGLQTTQLSPISARFRFNPTDRLNLQAQGSYSGFFGSLISTSFSGGAEIGPHAVGLTWFTRYNAEEGETTSDQIRLFTGIELWKERLRLDTQINYDIERSLLQQQRYLLSYNSQCYSVQLEYRDFMSSAREETDIRLSVSLKNVGTFLDLTSGERQQF